MSSPSRDLDPLDQQLDDARLLGREELVPQRIELQQRVRTSSSVIWRPARVPHARCHDDLRLAEQGAELLDHGALDLAGRHAADRAASRPLQHRLAT